jgi:4-alpha-glucanotransferase
MNVPSVLEGNWSWRVLPGQLPPGVSSRLCEMTEVYGRGGIAKP